MREGYRGVVGAFGYAFRRSNSWLFRVYIVLSALLGVYISLLILLAIVAWSGTTVAFGDQAFLAVIGILLLVPLFTPVLVTARRLRRETSSASAERLIAITGFVFVLSIVLALLITDPTDHATSGSLGVLVRAIQGLPRSIGILPPVIAIVLIILGVRYTRPTTNHRENP